MDKNFKFWQEIKKEKTVEKISNIDITIAGSLNDTPEKNLELFGALLAERILAAIKKAKASGKKLVFDMATGRTSEPVWPILSKLINERSVDLDNIIVIGHEEAWGTYEKGGHSDFDNHRRKNFFAANNLPIKEITTERQLAKDELDGNFLPMHLNEDAQDSAEKYQQLLSSLRQRNDVIFFGFYGVGEDGHIGEIQIGSLGWEETGKRKNVFANNIQDYSFETDAPQLFRWQNEEGDFRPEDNVFWERQTDGQDSGRAIRDNYRGIQTIVGLGWREMLRQEKMILAFNDRNKGFAFRLALEGLSSGDIANQKDEVAIQVEQNKGIGKNILPELEALAKELEGNGILPGGIVEQNRNLVGGLKCQVLFKEIFKALDRVGAKTTDEAKYYQRAWSLINNYIGRRSPVSRLLKLRSFLNRPTEIVATPEVIRGTKYEALADEKK
jgi:6-phosphogluconolactonase/glucosamine-6-phosphate isomerase/deaminase